MIKIYIERNFTAYEKARFSFENLFELIGIKVAFIDKEEEADVIYSREEVTSINRSKLYLKATPSSSWNIKEPGIFFNKNGSAWVGEMKADGSDGDLVYSTYAFLTGALERNNYKDEWGVPIANNEYFIQNKILDKPYINEYSQILLQKISEALDVTIDAIPRWPHGKKYAICVSHDVDAPISYMDLDFRLKWLSKLAKSRDLQKLPVGMYGYLKTLLFKLIGSYPDISQDKNFAFEKWIEVEKKLGTKSCFYVSTVTPADNYGDVKDINYLYNKKEITKALNIVINQGWEIGLHGSINSHKQLSRIKEEKRKLESILDGYSLRGIRNHYWSVNRTNPEETISFHEDAGFFYDSSLGLNDAPGFRRGVAWPYKPFNIETNKIMNILEIPSNIMDGGVFYKNISFENGKKEIMEHIRNTFKYNGCVVLDWHLEQFNPKRLNKAGPALIDVLMGLVTDSDIYWTSPNELAEWWEHRKKMIDEKTY